MSCIHNVWNCYCKFKEEVIDTPCSPLCKYYCTEETIEMINKFNWTETVFCQEGLALAEQSYKSTAENDYVSLLERFINTLYINEDYHWGFFGYDATRAEERVEEDMFYLGFTEDEVRDAYTIVCAKHMHIPNACKIRLHQFISRMLDKKKKKEHDEYPLEFRFVLTLILGYLGKLNTVDIILCHEPKIYFKSQVDHVSVSELRKAFNKTRAYVKESRDSNLAEGMRKVEAWIEELGNKTIPPKELTIADIEEQLGYKIKIVGDKE